MVGATGRGEGVMGAREVEEICVMTVWAARA